MRKISYFLLTSTAMLLFACGGKKTEQPSAEGEKDTDPIVLYGEIDRTSAPNTITEAEKSKGWQLLFDGTTGNGWHGYNQKGIPDCWGIEDGTLTMKSKGAQEEEQDLLTDKEYKSFALSLEYKMTKGANSGIVFQIKEDPKYRFAYETGPEFQVIDHENWHDKLEDWQINGGNYAMYPPMAKPYKALGEWNQLMLVVNGNDVTQILNGVITVKYTKYSDEWTKLRNSGKWSAFPDYGKYDEGRISLQNHGTKVWYRNILLKELK